MPQHRGLVKAVAGALRRRCGVSAGATTSGSAPGSSPDSTPGSSPGSVRLVVAVSGGADSVALLRALAAIAPRRGRHLTLAVAHVQHHLRQPQGEEDAAFVAELAQSLDLPFLRADLDAAALRQQGNIEAAARHARYAALAEMARAFDAPFLATAHQADDQLETLLMRMLRGTSLSGLRGIAWRRRLRLADHAAPIMLIRPMLGVSRADVRAHLRDLGQPWREDHTNADLSRLRARLRHDVLPVLHDLRPDAGAKAVTLAQQMAQACRVVDLAIAAAADHVQREGATASFDRSDARTWSPLVLAGLLRRLLAIAGVAADRLGTRCLEPIIRAIRDSKGGTRQFQPGDGVQITVTRNAVRVEGVTL